MAEPEKVPPPLRPASTVILVREKNQALEVYLLRRSTQSGFMGGLYVFPGGVVDPEDRDFNIWAPHVDLSMDQLETQLGGTGVQTEDILGFSTAAIRETLEEAGVFIANSRNKTPEAISQICRFRLNPDLSRSWFRNRILSENWILSFSSLGRWSHWITPELMKKRFDTRFFIVFMPEDQTCVTDNMETTHGIWLTPQVALEQNLENLTPLAPPTVVTLTQMLKFSRLSDLKKEVQTRSWGEPIAPRLLPTPEGPVILEPWDPMWHSSEPVDTSNLGGKILPPGAWFSRIWCDKGVWKPVGV